MNAAPCVHPFFTMQTQPIKTIELSMENGVMTEREVQPKPTTSKTYGRGKLRVNLNSPRGNIYAVWGLALNLMKQCHYTEEETSKNLAELKKDTYEECLQAFGKHKIFGNLFKLYSSPKYMTQYDEGEWGNPDEQTTECEACGDEIEGNDEDENDGLCYLCREA